MCVTLKMNNYQVLSKSEIADSLIEYNPIHLTMVDFEFMHLVNDIHHQTNFENFQYILGIIMSLYGIYYFVNGIIDSIFKN